MWFFLLLLLQYLGKMAGKYGPERTLYLDISHSEGKKIDIVFMTAVFKLIFKMHMETVIKLLMHLTC